MKDIKRVFMYHGAEHKSINCVENGLPLTVENVRAQSREHKRCGTSFMLYVMVLSVLFFMCIRVDNFWLRIVFRLLLIPVIAGLSYEFIRLAGRTTNPVITALSKPGLLLQKLTTREPDDSMIEVAITSVEAVFDWKEFLEKFEQKDEAAGKKQKKKTGTKAKTKNKKASKETAVPEADEAVVANVRVGGITDPIEDLDDDFDIIPEIADKKETEKEAEAVEEQPEAEGEEAAEETAGEGPEAETEETAGEEPEAETEETAGEEPEAEPEKASEDKSEEKAEEAEDKSEDKPEEKVEEKSEDKAEEKTEEKSEDEPEEKTEEKSEDKAEKKSDDEDHLGFFKGRRSTGKNTGFDSAPEPTKGVNHRAPVEIEKRAIPEEDDEDDEVLKKLDRFFVNKNKKD
jgi:hypothetical protein